MTRELPAPLRAGAEEVVARVGRPAVAAAAQRLSGAYRAKGAEAARAARTEADVAAYLAVRAPATYAAALDVLRRVRAQRPEWEPASVLDVGAGPGVASWAATEVWPGLERVTLVEAEPEMARVGRALAAEAPSKALRTATWVTGDLSAGSGEAQLVLVSYVLNELAAARLVPVVRAVWARAEDTIVLLEPGTPAGYAAVLRARDTVLAAGGQTVAPCPHDLACPLPPGDWCHFGVRLARSGLHRSIKGVERGFEDEKISYAVLSRTRAPRAEARVIRQPRLRSGHVYLDLCEPAGVRTAVVSRRDRDAYRSARKAAWGDAVARPPDDKATTAGQT